MSDVPTLPRDPRPAETDPPPVGERPPVERGARRERRAAKPELVRRVLVSAAGIPLAIAAIYAGGWILGGLLALLAAGGARELYRLAACREIRAFATPGTASAAGFVLLSTARPSLESAAPLLWSLTLLLFLASFAAAPRCRGSTGRPTEAVAVTLMGAVYTGGSLSFAVFLRNLPASAGLGGRSDEAGAALLLLPVVIAWTADTAAYFVGHAWGRHRLSPSISPGKTVEGAVAGLVGAALAGLLYASMVLPGAGIGLAPAAAAAGGLLLAALGQLGDLGKSALKREAGVKDSGTLFPGHGGILDRFDSLLFTFPVAYGLLRLLLHAGAPG